MGISKMSRKERRATLDWQSTYNVIVLFIQDPKGYKEIRVWYYHYTLIYLTKHTKISNSKYFSDSKGFQQIFSKKIGYLIRESNF